MKFNVKNLLNSSAKVVAVLGVGFLAFTSACTSASNTSKGMGGTSTDTPAMDNTTSPSTEPATTPETTPSTDPAGTVQPVDSTRR